MDEATGLLRAQAMDPFHEVKALACETMISFCYNHHEILLYFAEPLGRSLTSCLTHNHAKLRIVALRALTAVLACGVWKTNHDVIQILMAWQDPNSVPVKAFYEPVTSVNYMSTLSFDRHPAVRRFWFETMAYWLLRVPDKCDHEPYIFPYLLTGLCDENEEIALEVFWLIEKCGELYEAEHEVDLRKTRQYGFDHGWTYEGRAFVPFPLQGIWAGGGQIGAAKRITAQGPDLMGEMELSGHVVRDSDLSSIDYGEELQLPARDYAWPELRDVVVYRNLPRPRLGSRCWVRTNARRYITRLHSAERWQALVHDACLHGGRRHGVAPADDGRLMQVLLRQGGGFWGFAGHADLRLRLQAPGQFPRPGVALDAVEGRVR